MTPNESTSVPGVVAPLRGGLAGAKVFSTITLLAGIWFFVSPWVYGSYAHGVAINNWIAGGLVIVFAIARLARPAYSTAMCWANMVLGIWLFCSPWIYGYAATDAARFINSIIVGIVVFICAVISWRISVPRIPRTGAPLSRT